MRNGSVARKRDDATDVRRGKTTGRHERLAGKRTTHSLFCFCLSSFSPFSFLSSLPFVGGNSSYGLSAAFVPLPPLNEDNLSRNPFRPSRLFRVPRMKQAAPGSMKTGETGMKTGHSHHGRLAVTNGGAFLPSLLLFRALWGGGGLREEKKETFIYSSNSFCFFLCVLWTSNGLSYCWKTCNCARRDWFSKMTVKTSSRNKKKRS